MFCKLAQHSIKAMF
ncbi:hypothetical protein ACRRCN_000441 [Escherichia coli]|nr:hypothetical protein [Escherichia coli]EIH0338260.1 hypothetical protein [Escherichia coli O22]EHP3459203.1 hypothetical protein [Escherichia coli]EHZ2477658.1 hypothetical protein [Escherichia coli]EIH2569984.1 hypothetical protein [Escherichia coli]EIH2588963.1 hypothetical protein [Escherichia coli]